MISISFTTLRMALALLLVTVLFSACSSSSSPGNANPEPSTQSSGSSGNQTADTTGNNASGGNPSLSDGSTSGNTTGGQQNVAGGDGANTIPASTTVTFDITVPVYVSDSLQVTLAWGEQLLSANWVSDESWIASGEFPTNTSNELQVTFYDDNGAITLGHAELVFNTGNAAATSHEIMASQFNTAMWDRDGDGVSNLDELRAGTNPVSDDTLEAVQATLTLVAIKKVRLSWQPVTGARFYRVFENPDGVSGYTQISDDLSEATDSFEHRIALYNRANAQYLVQACNDSACTDSNELMVAGSIQSAIGYFKATNTDAGDEFGGAIALSADGTTLVVGAKSEDSAASGVNADQTDNSARWSGAVYVFQYSNGAWQEQAYLKAGRSDEGDYFGASVSLSANGNTLAVGAYQENSAPPESNADDYSPGAVYVFTRNNGTWQQQAYMKASNARTAFDAFFGFKVSLSADGNTLAVGDIFEDGSAVGVNGTHFNYRSRYSGAVYIYSRDNGSWRQRAYIKASNPDRGDYFGQAVSLSADGNTLAVGATREASNATGINGNQMDNSVDYAGAVYVFGFHGGTWQQQAYIKSSASVEGFSAFGNSVSLSANGNTLAVGGATGVAALYTRTNQNWQLQTELISDDVVPGETMGWSVSLSADAKTLAVGSYYNPNDSENSDNLAGAETIVDGRVFVYKNSVGEWQQQSVLSAAHPESGDAFGGLVVLSADGQTLATGARGEDSAARGSDGYQLDNSKHSAGAVYLF